MGLTVAFLLINASLEAVYTSGCSISTATLMLCSSHPSRASKASKRETERGVQKEEGDEGGGGHNALRRALGAARLRGGACCRRRHRRASSEWQLRVRSAQVGPCERHGGEGRQRDPQVADVGFRGVHRVRAEAGRHAPGGAAGRARRSAGQRGLHPPAPLRDPGRLLRRHLQRRAHLRPGGDHQHLRQPRVRRAPHADHLRQQRLGLLLLGVQSQARRGGAGHPQPGRRGGPRVRPADRRRRHQDAVPAHAHQGQHAQERRLRGGPLLPAQRVLGGAGAAQHRGRPLAASRVDDHVVQGRQVHRRRALQGAGGRARRGAGGRQGERAGAGGAHRAGVDLPPVLRRRRRQRRMHGVHGRRGLRGARHRQGAVQLQWRRRVQARRAGVRGRPKPHQGGVPEHILPHETRRHALRAGHRRRQAHSPAQEDHRAQAHAVSHACSDALQLQCTAPRRSR